MLGNNLYEAKISLKSCFGPKYGKILPYMRRCYFHFSILLRKKFIH